MKSENCWPHSRTVTRDERCSQNLLLKLAERTFCSYTRSPSSPLCWQCSGLNWYWVCPHCLPVRLHKDSAQLLVRSVFCSLAAHLGSAVQVEPVANPITENWARKAECRLLGRDWKSCSKHMQPHRSKQSCKGYHASHSSIGNMPTERQGERCCRSSASWWTHQAQCRCAPTYWQLLPKNHLIQRFQPPARSCPLRFSRPCLTSPVCRQCPWSPSEPWTDWTYQGKSWTLQQSHFTFSPPAPS